MKKLVFLFWCKGKILLRSVLLLNETAMVIKKLHVNFNFFGQFIFSIICVWLLGNRGKKKLKKCKENLDLTPAPL